MSAHLKPRFRLRDPELLRILMQHTGDGSRTTVRDLANAANCHYSLIGRLLNGELKATNVEIATAISTRIGVDLLILWTPEERTARVTASVG